MKPTVTPYPTEIAFPDTLRALLAVPIFLPDGGHLGFASFISMHITNVRNLVATDGEFELVFGTFALRSLDDGSLVTLVNDARLAAGKGPAGASSGRYIVEPLTILIRIARIHQPFYLFPRVPDFEFSSVETIRVSQHKATFALHV